MSHSRNWGTGHPGCLIFLLDQSGSMAGEFGQQQVGSGVKKCDVVANVLNKFLHELTERNTVGSEVRDRADIAVLGYHGSDVVPALSGALAGKDWVTLTELKESPIEIKSITKKVYDGAGGFDEIVIEMPVWVTPKDSGQTPMCKALRVARELALRWSADHNTSYPPVIVNVTDGAATDGDFRLQARALTSDVFTQDGNALLFNCHITDQDVKPVVFPSKEQQIPSDQLARMLFEVASPIPDGARQLYSQVSKEQLEIGARGFVFNGDALSIHRMFTFATAPALAIVASQPSLPSET